MKPGMLLLLVAVLTAIAVLVMRTSWTRISGCSFTHQGGDCVIWYARDGNQILDILIVPRATFAANYEAGSRRLRIGETDVTFGNTHKAYIFDAGEWRVVALDGLTESDLPSVADLEQCFSTGEIARNVLGRQEVQPPN
jgi:hypothetical protein